MHLAADTPPRTLPRWPLSAQSAAGRDSREILDRVAEGLLQHLDRVLAEARRGGARAVVVAEDAKLMALVPHLAHLGVLQRPEELPVTELRIVDVVARALHHARGSSGCLQPD